MSVEEKSPKGTPTPEVEPAAENPEVPEEAPESGAEGAEQAQPEETAEEPAESEDAAKEEEPTPDFPAMIQEMQDKLMRQAAEFENYKKRSQADFQTRLKYANVGLVKDLLPGLDNLERAIEHATNGEHDSAAMDSFVEGVKMVKQQFYDALAKNQVIRFDPLGEPFDPNHHEAVGMVPSKEYPNDHVAVVMQAGYKQYDRVLRPAMVQVARQAEAEEDTNQPNESQSN